MNINEIGVPFFPLFCQGTIVGKYAAYIVWGLELWISVLDQSNK